jgi:malonate-semialdehyde dehydrogenase (acetylating) / methylmalonate-semialdehyde dehydrogenase
MENLHNFINGTTMRATSERTSPVYNPATGETRYHVHLSNINDTEEAIAAAKAAFPGWANTTPLRRARVMFKFKELIEANFDELVSLITTEHGKVYSDAKGELTRGLEVVEFVCGIPELLKGEHSCNVGSSIDSWSMMQPLGVCAGITPFNFPAMVPMWMYPVAIACGNTFVLKPSERDPLLSVRMASLLKEAGLPDGVFNVVNGDKEAVDVLLTHPAIMAVSFVGSTPIARYIYSTASAHGKRVQALAGAKNHAIIMPDADMEVTARAMMGAAYGSAGERCMAISVAVPVGDETAERFIEVMKPLVENLKIGNGLAKPEPEMGPLVTPEHLQRVSSYVDLGVKEGAQLVVDGRNFKVADYPQGFYIGGSLFDRVSTEMRIYQEEIFGPVLSTVRSESFAHALEITNGHPFGNGAAIFTRDGNTGREFASQIQAGMVGINVPIPVPMAYHSFGGWKDSLFGVNHVHGPDGVRFYTKMKTVTCRWASMARSENTFVMPTMK